MARDRASRPEAKPLRLFVAFDIPEEAKRAIDQAVAPVRERFPAARWVPEANWHVTVKFLGRTFPRLVDEVHERVGSVARASGPVKTRLTGLGAFPSNARARVVWVGVDDPAGAMAKVAAELDLALAPWFASESRPFRPHVTVARSDPPLAAPIGSTEPQVRPVSFRVAQLTLYRSHLRRPAPRYEPLARLPLGGASAGRTR